MEKEKMETGTLPFGKRVKCGNYYVLKTARTLSRSELKRLRSNDKVPSYIKKHLQRGTLPCIKVSTVVDSWNVQFMVGMTMFNAIDEIPVFHDGDGNYEFLGEQALNLANLINFWACATSTVGDVEFQADVINAMHRYLDRMSEKNKKPLAGKDNESVLKEEENTERRGKELLEMAKEIENDGKF